MQSRAREIPCLKKWLFLKPMMSFPHLFCKYKITSTIPKDMEGLNCSFSTCCLLPYNEGTLQPKKVTLHHPAK